jgi:hypothetical protein
MVGDFDVQDVRPEFTMRVSFDNVREGAKRSSRSRGFSCMQPESSLMTCHECKKVVCV